MAATTPAATITLTPATRRRTSLIFEVRDQLLDQLDVLGAERTVLGEVGDQGGDLAVEQAVDQPLALRLHIVAARDQRPVEIALGRAPALDRALLQEAG